MDVIGQVTRPLIQSQHPGHSWHMFGGLVWLRGSRTSVDDHPNVLSKRFLNVLIVSDSITETGRLFHATGAR